MVLFWMRTDLICDLMVLYLVPMYNEYHFLSPSHPPQPVLSHDVWLLALFCDTFNLPRTVLCVHWIGSTHCAKWDHQWAYNSRQWLSLLWIHYWQTIPQWEGPLRSSSICAWLEVGPLLHRTVQGFLSQLLGVMPGMTMSCQKVAFHSPSLRLLVLFFPQLLLYSVLWILERMV